MYFIGSVLYYKVLISSLLVSASMCCSMGSCPASATITRTGVLLRKEEVLEACWGFVAARYRKAILHFHKDSDGRVYDFHHGFRVSSTGPSRQHFNYPLLFTRLLRSRVRRCVSYVTNAYSERILGVCWPVLSLRHGLLHRGDPYVSWWTKLLPISGDLI